MTNEALKNIIQRSIGLIGYFEGRVESVEQRDGKITVTWSGACANPFPLVFDQKTGAVIK